MGAAEGIGLLKDVFSESPSLGFVAILSAWLGRAWWFRMVEVGPKRSFAADLLSAFKASSPIEPGLNRLGAGLVQPTAGSLTEEWTVLEIFMIYAMLQARAWVVKFATAALAFTGICLAFMKLAQPTGTVSLPNVIQVAGLACLLPLAALLALAVASIVAGAHTLPTGKERKPSVVFLCAW